VGTLITFLESTTVGICYR